ncbi:LptE family protein [Plebeiibacterium sediminum]|uniref:LPS assembly lipoprotein LptE n=1 Tax=Plebeiibacterium sediminum TaxID=2992112 RepID=A0AAE3M4Z4_9BACT|nr:LptE family protein [Plebeiobacterium sediminum]MCW3787163.1 LPS assembly lipoprotein LptE [Plebeiobacterium sediminum]
MTSKAKIGKGILLGALMALSFVACKIEFTLKGASVPAEWKTFSVQYFENRAPLINPTLSQEFTEALKDRVINESKLVLEERNADIDFSGQITGYNVKPMAIQADAISAETRLTITVKVKYRNFKDPKQNWESSFSGYEDYSSDRDINDVENELTELIIEKITQDIFNKAFSDW